MFVLMWIARLIYGDEVVDRATQRPAKIPKRARRRR